MRTTIIDGDKVTKFTENDKGEVVIAFLEDEIIAKERTIERFEVLLNDNISLNMLNDMLTGNFHDDIIQEQIVTLNVE